MSAVEDIEAVDISELVGISDPVWVFELACDSVEGTELGELGGPIGVPGLVSDPELVDICDLVGKFESDWDMGSLEACPDVGELVGMSVCGPDVTEFEA